MDLKEWLLADISQNIPSIILGILVFFLTRWWLSEKSSNRYNLPPGPWAFPLIGNLPQILLVKEFNRALVELSKKYGDVYRLRIGSSAVVVVCGLDILKEGLIKKGDAIKGRPYWTFIIDKIFKKKETLMDLKEWLLAGISQNIPSIILGILVFFLTRWWLSEKSSNRYNLPPGPMAFPLIGNLPQILLVKEYSRALIELSKKYGDVYRLRVGPWAVVVVCGLDILKEGLITRGDALKGRPHWIFVIERMFKKKETLMDLKEWILVDISQNIPSIILGILVFFLTRWWLSEKSSNRYNLPPGPWAFPLIGNLPQMLLVKEFRRSLVELSKKYGDVYRLRVGSFAVVVVCGLETLKEGLIQKGDIFKGRPHWIFIFDKIFKKKGILFNTGQEWKDMRRFTVSTLRDFGMGKSKLEEKIHAEAIELAKVIESHQGKPFNLKIPMGNGVINVIYNIVFGQRLDYTAPDFIKLFSILDFLFKTAGTPLAEDFLPWLHYIRWDSPARKLLRNDQILRAHVQQRIQEHRETFDANNIRDFIDMYILITQEEKSESYSEANIFRTIVDLFSAGSETTATSLLWIFLYMAKYPDTQQQCREEIRQVTDFSRFVKMSDREELPFVNATILELQRIATVVPGAVPHVAEEDTTLGGYDIPKGTIVNFMFDGVHTDPKYWKDPHLFDPNRWLTDEKKIIKHEAYLPFSWGPRSCLGEPLAKMEMFLFFCNLLQQFEFTSPDEKPVSLKGQVTGITYQPISAIICAKPI